MWLVVAGEQDSLTGPGLLDPCLPAIYNQFPSIHGGLLMTKKPILTKEQMKARYPNQWLLVRDYELDDSTRLCKGRVVVHSKDREEIHHALKKRSGSLCIHFTGSLAPDTGILFSCLE